MYLAGVHLAGVHLSMRLISLCLTSGRLAGVGRVETGLVSIRGGDRFGWGLQQHNQLFGRGEVGVFFPGYRSDLSDRWMHLLCRKCHLTYFPSTKETPA